MTTIYTILACIQFIYIDSTFIQTINHPESSTSRISTNISSIHLKQEPTFQTNTDYIKTYDEFYNSINKSAKQWNEQCEKEIIDKELSPFDFPVDYMLHIPDQKSFSTLSVWDSELLAALAYKCGNIRCLEYICRTKLQLSYRRSNSRLSDEIKCHNRAEAIALFLLYEPMTERERLRCLCQILTKHGIAQWSKILHYYSLYHYLNLSEGVYERHFMQPYARKNLGSPTDIHFF